MRDPAWYDMERWLRKGIEYLEERENILSTKSDSYSRDECIRIRGKKDGLRVCLEYMKESEKIYQGEE